jgi:hypothetical protein
MFVQPWQTLKGISIKNTPSPTPTLQYPEIKKGLSKCQHSFCAGNVIDTASAKIVFQSMQILRQVKMNLAT